MSSFFDKIREEVEYPDDVNSFIIPVFNTPRIGTRQLSSLTDAKLERIGIAQLGLREAILKVLGKE